MADLLTAIDFVVVVPLILALLVGFIGIDVLFLGKKYQKRAFNRG